MKTSDLAIIDKGGNPRRITVPDGQGAWVAPREYFRFTVKVDTDESPVWAR